MIGENNLIANQSTVCINIDGYAKKYRRDSLICITYFLEKSKKITVYRYIISPGLSRNLSYVLDYSYK